MTQQEMETIIQELETTFKQPVNEKPWTSDGLTFGRYINEVPDYQTKQFKTTCGVALWFNNEIVVTITRVNQWEAFKSVARLFCQVETIGTHTGRCIGCERVSIVSDASHLCEACTLDAQVGNDGQWEFKPLA